jgi:DNA polymerase V
MLYVEDEYTALSRAALPEELPDSRFIASGFPAASDDYATRPLNLHELLVRHPSATFFMRCGNNDMAALGIHRGDLLVIDRSMPPLAGSLVVVAIAGELSLQRLVRRDGRLWLDNGRSETDYTDQGSSTTSIWGVVAHTVRSFTPVLPAINKAK